MTEEGEHLGQHLPPRQCQVLRLPPCALSALTACAAATELWGQSQESKVSYRDWLGVRGTRRAGIWKTRGQAALSDPVYKLRPPWGSGGLRPPWSACPVSLHCVSCAVCAGWDTHGADRPAAERLSRCRRVGRRWLQGNPSLPTTACRVLQHRCVPAEVQVPHLASPQCPALAWPASQIGVPGFESHLGS